MMSNYEEINMELKENKEMFNKTFPLLTTTPQKTIEIQKMAGIKEDRQTTRLNTIFNHYCYCKRVIVKDFDGSHATWRLLLPGEIWHSVEPRPGRRPRVKNPKQSTLDVHSDDDIKLPRCIIDRINDNAKKNGLTYQQQVRQDLIKLYENYVIEIVLTDIEIRKVDALVSIWGKSKEDATAEVLSERESSIKPPRRKRGESILTDGAMYEYLPLLEKPKSTRQILTDLQQKTDGINRQIVGSKLRIFKNKGYLKSSVTMTINQDGLQRKTEVWSLTEIGKQKLKEVA